jgi:recombination protein RecR
MTGFAAPIVRLIDALKALPGVGQKSATRLAFHLLKRPREEAEALARSIEDAARSIRPCATCGNFSEKERCDICSDERRDPALLCVVEEAANLPAIERTGLFRGRYHVLGGALSPLRGIGPEELRTASLLDRVRGGEVREVILATSPNVEGEATAVFLAGLLRPLGVRVTRIAQGLPVGSELEFTDDMTLAKALEARREF